MHDVLVPLIPGFQPLDVIGPHEVFAVTSVLAAGETAGYAIRRAAAAAGPVRSDSGLDLVATEALPEHGPIRTLHHPRIIEVLGGLGGPTQVFDRELAAGRGG
ncbi:MAG TPA: hypothetical protein VIU87_13660 [Mycobacterium sp.]